MKTAGVVHLGNFKFFLMIRENLATVIFTLIFTVGFFLCVLLFSDNLFVNESELLFGIFDKIRIEYDFATAYVSVFLFEFLFIFLIFVFGTSLLGLAFIPMVVFLRGAVSGLLISKLYSALGLTGITLNLLTLLPATVINALSLISAAVYGLNLSYALSKTMICAANLNMGFRIKFILKKFGIYTVIILIGTLIEIFSIFAFKKFFV